MKRIIIIIAVFLANVRMASAQLLPSFQFGVKGGVNFTDLNFTNPSLSSNNRAGYLGGLWARVGALGFNFQPEMYLTSKSVEITNSLGGETKATFTSVDVPLLLGGKIGAFGIGGRFYTGPLVSFAINKSQTFGGAVHDAVNLDYKDQNLAWVLGAGLDIRNISIDLRYEAGITKQTYGDAHTRVSLFNISLAVPLIKI